MTFKKRYVVLGFIAVAFIYLIAFREYSTVWSDSGDIVIKGPQEHSYHLLTTYNSWPDWLVWGWDPAPTIKVTGTGPTRTANVYYGDTDLIAQIKPGRHVSNKHANYSIKVGDQPDNPSMMGSCEININDISLERDGSKHKIKWKCQGIFTDNNQPFLLRMGIFPTPPYGIATSFGRLKAVVESTDPADRPEAVKQAMVKNKP